MKRNEWKMPYAAPALAQAAATKLAYHEERLAWWGQKRIEVMDRIRAEGIEVDERQVLSHPHPKALDWDRGAKVIVRNDLKDDLEECLSKLRWHTERRREFDGWLQALQANGQLAFELDIEDWLYFFGRN